MIEEGQGGQFNQADFDIKRAKTCYRFGKLCDRLLRKMEISPLMSQAITDSLASVNSSNLDVKSKKKQA